MERGESDEAAAVREVAEETGLSVVVAGYLGSVRRPAPGGGVLVIRDFVARVDGDAVPVAGDDADDVRWVTRAELAELPVVDGLVAALSAWSVMPD